MRQLRLVLVFAAVVVGCYYVGFLTASFFKHGCSLAAACGRLPQATHDLLAALGYVAVGVAGLAADLLARSALRHSGNVRAVSDGAARRAG